MLTALAAWWGLGNAVGGLLAWPLIVNFSCAEDATHETCSSAQNMGWRYQYILIGGLTFVLAVIRVFFMKMEESPKWLVSQGEFEKAVEVLHEISRVNKKAIDLNVSYFQTLPETVEHKVNDKVLTHAVHLRGLFLAKKLALSTSGLILLWICIGIAYVAYTHCRLLLT